MIFWWLACTGGTWSPEAVLERSLEALPASHGPGLEREAWEASRYAAPAFEEVDADGDQVLSTRELEVHLRAQDPLWFDEPDRVRQSLRGRRRKARLWGRYRLRERTAVLLFLHAELRGQVDPALLPTRGELEEAATGAEPYEVALQRLSALHAHQEPQEPGDVREPGPPKDEEHQD